ncbi:MAG: TolC family protein [Elusimicrobiota bacterium]|jgi:TolC family type I secretion outer membrane protein|nr:TolC family protein [Elusimicrobiota bacterium]
MDNIHSKIIAGAALAAVLFLTTADISAQTAAQNPNLKENTLTLEQCIEITLKNNPRIAAASSTAQSQRDRLSQTKAGYLPQVSGSASYSRADSELSDRNWRGTENSYSSSISASQLIYDFGKTGLSTDIQKNSYYASLQDSESTKNSVVYELKQAYIAVLAATEQYDVFTQSVEQYQEQLKRAQAFYDVGTRPRIDVTTAQVNLNNAKLNLIKAENTLKIAKQKLLNIMGLHDRAADFVLEKQSEIPQFKLTLDNALKQALENRPDLSSYKLKLESARQNVKLSATGFAPELNANGSYGWSGDDFPLNDRWSVGAGVSFPIFSGFSTINKIKESKNSLNTAYYNLTDAQQNALLDVRTCHSNLREAASRIPVADISRRQAQENYDLAVGRYTVGVGTYIEVKDAEVSLSNAKLSYISAVFDYNLAIADLKRAMGTR